MTDLTQLGHRLAAAAQGPPAGLLERLCTACTQTLPVEGAAISVMSRADRPMARSASDDRVTRLEELQFTLGEGPAVEAFQRRSPVCLPDLTVSNAEWPVFAAEAGNLVAASGWEIRSVIALPLTLGREAMGVMDLYRHRSGPMDAELAAQAKVATDVVALALLASSVEGDEEPAWLPPLLPDQVTVDQAIGMVMAQLDLDPEQALALLRAHAFGTGRILKEVATAVVDRELRLSKEDG